MIIKLIEKFEEKYQSPLRHRVGKLVICGVAGTVASAVADKAYDLALECYRIKKSAKA